MRRRLLAAVAAAAIGMSGGIAYAYFTSTGSGSGTVLTGTTQSVAISATVTSPTTPLIPGGTGDATFKVANPNSVGVTVVSVVGNGPIAVSGGSGCTASNSGVAFTDQNSLSIAVPAGASEFTIDLPNSVSMSASSDNGCQGASFSIPVLMTVHQG